MAFGRLERGTVARPIADINMTPLIDVMLVLLVIFIITAPLLTGSLKLDLPRAGGAPAAAPARAAVVSLDRDGSLFLGDERLAAPELQARLQALARQAPDTEIQLRADRNVPYGRVAELIGWAQRAGLNRVAFVTERP